jgi:hypothetical protein
MKPKVKLDTSYYFTPTYYVYVFRAIFSPVASGTEVVSKINTRVLGRRFVAGKKEQGKHPKSPHFPLGRKNSLRL